MKTIKRTSSILGLLIVLSIIFSANSFAQNTVKCNQVNTELKNIDLGCITKRASVKTGHNCGLLIKSKKFVFYINRKEKNLLFVSNKLTFSKGDFNCI